MWKNPLFQLVVGISSLFCISSGGPVQTVTQLDVRKYQGVWYQVYADPLSYLATERGGSCVRAEYSLVSDGTLSVYNTEVDSRGFPSSIRGTANVTDPTEPGQLTVYFNNRTGAPYWVIDLGPEVDHLYDYSVVSDPRGKGLFVLARDISRFLKEYDNSVSTSLQEKGFRLLPTPQNDCVYPL